MTTPFGSGHEGIPAPPGGTPPPPPPPGATLGAPPPPYQTAPPAGYQAYEPAMGAAGLPRAGFGARLGGYLLDSLLYGLLGAVFFIPGIIVLVSAFDGCVSFENQTLCPPGKPEGSSIAAGIGLMLIGLIVVVVLYIRALGRTGQTWGRKIAGVKVVGSTSGQPIGIGKAIGRQLFAGFISGQIFYLGYLWMIWDDKKQTWHDKIVDSIVVKV